MKYVVFFVLVFFLIGTLVIPQSLAQDIVPAWIKNNAGWWADDKIDDFTFAQGIGFLIKNKIIQINDLPTTPDGEISIENDIVIPSWIKNNADWWADDKISDFTFAQGIGYLIKNKIIQISDLPTTTDGEIAIEKDIVIPSWTVSYTHLTLPTNREV